MSELLPIPKRSNGDDRRDENGRFLPGCRGGPGSPIAKHASELHRRLTDALHEVVTPNRLANAIDAVLKLAEQGDVQALRLILERVSPIDQAIALRIGRIESLMENPNDESTEE